MIAEQFEVSGLYSTLGQVRATEHLHHHNDIEINIVCQGSVTYILGGQLYTLNPANSIVFWAISPHCIVECQDNTVLGVLHIPLTEFLRWQLPRDFSEPIVHGRLLVYQSTDFSLDHMMFARWAKEIQNFYTGGDPQVMEDHHTILLEARAYLKRTARLLSQHPKKHKLLPSFPENLSKVEHIASFIAKRYTEAITIDDIAKDADLHPNYAMNMFKKSVGLTVLQYVTQQRLAHAQRLLITSNMDILDIALDSGFGSLSRFYAVFKTWVGSTPTAYRAKYQ